MLKPTVAASALSLTAPTYHDLLFTVVPYDKGVDIMSEPSGGEALSTPLYKWINHTFKIFTPNKGYAFCIPLAP